jgi:hypothetical protein
MREQRNLSENQSAKSVSANLKKIESFNPEYFKLDLVSNYVLQKLKNQYQQTSKTLFSGLITYPVFTFFP